MYDIEHVISEINATMAIENMPLTELDKENLRSVLLGKISYQDLRERILADYQHKRLIT